MDADENHSKDLPSHSERNPPESEDDDCKDNDEISESKTKQPENEKNTKNKKTKIQQKSKRKSEENVDKQKRGRASTKTEEAEVEDEANNDSQEGKKTSEDPGDNKTLSTDETNDKQEERKKERGGRKSAKKNETIKEGAKDQGKLEEKSSKPLDSNVPMMDDPNLPSGWYRKVVQRRTGKTAGQFDVYLYSPEGKKFRSRFELITYLVKTHSPLKADDFDFTVRGKNNTSRSTSKSFGSVLSKKKTENKKGLPKKSNATKSPIKKTQRKPKRHLVVKLGIKANRKRHLEEDEPQEKQNVDSQPLKKEKVEVKKISTPIKHKKGMKIKKTRRQR